MKNLLKVSACVYTFFLMYECALAKYNENIIDHNDNSNEYIKYKTLKNISHDNIGYIINGKLTSYNWFIKDKFNNILYEYNFDSNLGNGGLDTHGIFELNLKNNDSNAIYGIKFQMLVPMIKGRIVAFANTPYGNISLGYQEGVESEMKIDAFSVAAGDTSSEWTKYIRSFLPIHDEVNNIPFYRSSGLYSEHLFRNHNNHFSINLTLRDNNFIDNLPFRISYKSLNFNGFAFGVSYSPEGNKKSIMQNSNINVINIVRLDYDMNQFVDSALSPIYRDIVSPYTNIISGAMSYNGQINDLQFNASIVGEYAKPMTIDNLKSVSNEYINSLVNGYMNLHLHSYDYYLNYDRLYKHLTEYVDIHMDMKYHTLHNLAGVALGASAQYKNLKLGGAYGYLGQSGVINYENIDLKEYFDGDISFPKQHSYYWNIGASYKYNNLLLSVTYFKSFVYSYYIKNMNAILSSESSLNDLGIGIDYTFYNMDRVNYKIFANYHYFNTMQYYVINTNNIDNGIKDNQGSIVLSGIKIEF
ncbi:hypothetical protein HL033_04000 [Neoehrlichia mikurensis]|uniref:Porin domain-containing protein n=1 Tax=Neoehrlichia mikurensis TaxID=89586 RepID=A0A9Q9BUS8_9RICK|nr:hypothetical protein [Neoehrlichia mikurensis]QXK91888.1 hypothetical protein IAH97_03995 [Neoehrlichia mikurensis]QXK93101.1 hypothetical protein HUN61_03990 [Neoehrlichia mikurensis]QXK93581.1 hypothetical protein HL033_04000 [Neoehrlichia mikurensis]UTO55466.1 hypothetical protein LUA82_04880 [Neoehrlichia mikurensis]UTO56386.1 hypothetical protein LUA81_04825 [Neoehrlichia mikurensis]